MEKDFEHSKIYWKNILSEIRWNKIWTVGWKGAVFDRNIRKF